MHTKSSTRAALLLGCLCAWIVSAATGLRAEGVVESCSALELEDAVFDGGLVTFAGDCPSLSLSNVVMVYSDTVIDAEDNDVTINGGQRTRLFEVLNGATLTLINLRLTGGSNVVGGAIYVHPLGRLELNNCVVFANTAAGTNGIAGAAGSSNPESSGGDGRNGNPGSPGSGGAIYSLGDVSLFDCTFRTNVAAGGNGGNGGAGGNGSGGGYRGGNGGNAAAGGLGRGGAILCEGRLEIVNCVFTANTARGGNGGTGGAGGDNATRTGAGGNGAPGGLASGGAVHASGEVVLLDSTFSNCLAQGGLGGAGGTNGAGFFPEVIGRASNGGDTYGGALFSSGELSIYGCTFATNRAVSGNGNQGGRFETGAGMRGSSGGFAYGGAVYAIGLSALTNSTLASNRAEGGHGGRGGDGRTTTGTGGNGGSAHGGAVYNDGSMLLLNCTVATNAAPGGTNGPAGTGFFPPDEGRNGNSRGGNLANGPSGVLELKNTIVAYGGPRNDAHGRITDLGNNIATDFSLQLGTGSKQNIDPRLGPLADYGGTNHTLVPLAGSPAIHAGDDAWAPELDQRGFPRLEAGDAGSDIGAVEGQTAIIETQPENRFPAEGTTATLSVEVSGDGPVTYQWRFNGQEVPGATNRVLAIRRFSPEKAGSYDVVIRNAFGEVISEAATVALGTAPVITRQPQSQSVAPGQTAQFTVEVNAPAPITYRWRLNGTNFTAANAFGLTNATLTIANVLVNQGGNYSVAITTPSGNITSSNAFLAIQSRLVPVGRGSNFVAVAFPTSAGVPYVTEYKTNLLAPEWTTYATNNGTGGLLTNLLPIAIPDPARYYRTRVR